MNNILEIITKRLGNVEKELEDVQERLRFLRWTVEEYRILLGESNACEKTQMSKTPHSIYEKPYARLTAIKTIESILCSSGKEMRVIEIAEAAIAGGYGGSEANKRTVVPNFSSAISRSFKNVNTNFLRSQKKGMLSLRQLPEIFVKT